MYSFQNKKRELAGRGVRYLLILLVLMFILAPAAYAQIPGAIEAVDPATTSSVKTVPPVTTVSGTTAAALPVTGQSILWIVIIGAVLLCGGIFLFLRTRKTQEL